MNIIQALDDPQLFGGLIGDPGTWKNWRVFLKGLFALPMEAGELAAFQEFTGRKTAPSHRFDEAYAAVGRRGGKSRVSAIVACFLALFQDWTPFLASGETGFIMVIANDRAQAQTVFSYIRSILQVPMFKPYVVKELAESIQLSNGITISVKTCDFRTIRGFTAVAAILDELSFWRSDGLNPAAEIIHALRPALATVPGSMLLGISSPYAKQGPLYEAFRESWGNDASDVLFWRAPTKAMNPKIEDKIIERALAKDRAVARAEWFAEFREDLETFLPTDIVERAVFRGRRALPFVREFGYLAFIDPSGGRADSYTLAIAHKEKASGRVILDRIEEKRPPFDPYTTTEAFAGVVKEYGISRVTSDRYGGSWVSDAWTKHGIRVDPSKLSRSEIYLEAEPLFSQGAVEILDNERLVNQLRGLERRTHSGGRDSVDHGPGDHDDVANAAAGALVMAAKDRPPLKVYWLDDNGNLEEPHGPSQKLSLFDKRGWSRVL